MTLPTGDGRRIAGPGRTPRTRGARCLVDLRPLQEPDRSPATADYLEALLGAYAADPLAGEAFLPIVQTGLPDPTRSLDALTDLPVVGRRPLPPTRLLRAGALTTDPFLLRSASLGADLGAGGRTLFHTASGSVPIASRLPVVVTLLDLAPWELRAAFGRSVAARFGHRLRARILRDAAAVIVPTTAAATGARRLLRVRAARLRLVRLAPRDAFRRAAAGTAGDNVPDTAGDRVPGATAADLDLPPRYLVQPGRYDARSDLGTLLGALAALAAAGRPPGLEAAVPWPPRVVLVDASPDDRAAIARAAARLGVGDLLSYVPHLPPARLAAVVAGARALVLPLLSAASSLEAIEAGAAGVPVVASAVGALPELVGAGGLLVRPRDEERLAAALATAWADDPARDRLAAAARAADDGRTWADVARETRDVYASLLGS